MAKIVDRDAKIARFFEKMEVAPKGKEVAVTAAANKYADDLEATGMVSMAILVGFGVVSRKTILKHIKAGELVGRKVKVGGVLTWLFEPQHARDYLERVVDLNREAAGRQGNRGKAEVPVGTLTTLQVAKMAGLSSWAVRDHITAGRLPATETGFRRLKVIKVKDAEKFAEAYRHTARPYRTKKEQPAKPAVVRPGTRDRRPLVVSDRIVLMLLILDQPGETTAALAKDLGVGRQTVANWKAGKSFPDDVNTGRLVAYARGRYGLRVGEELDELGKAYRASYMTSYMRTRRLSDDDA